MYLANKIDITSKEGSNKSIFPHQQIWGDIKVFNAIGIPKTEASIKLVLKV